MKFRLTLHVILSLAYGISGISNRLSQLLCLVFLREEAAAESLREHNEKLGYAEHTPIAKALCEVFENVGDDVLFIGAFSVAHRRPSTGLKP
jgi:hypothetical protein